MAGNGPEYTRVLLTTRRNRLSGVRSEVRSRRASNGSMLFSRRHSFDRDDHRRAVATRLGTYGLDPTRGEKNSVCRVGSRDDSN